MKKNNPTKHKLRMAEKKAERERRLTLHLARQLAWKTEQRVPFVLEREKKRRLEQLTEAKLKKEFKEKLNEVAIAA